jgi:hypothetical protein
MAARHWLGILGGVEIIVGALLNLHPDAPSVYSYALILIGVLTIVAAGFDWHRSSHAIRRLNRKQREIFTSALRTRGGIDKSTWIRFAEGCAECHQYAKDFEEAFRETGWNEEIGVSLDERHDLSGVRIVVKDPHHPSSIARTIAASMSEAKIKFDWWPNVQMADNQTIIWIYPA